MAVLTSNKDKSLSQNTSFGDSPREGTITTLSLDSKIQGHVPDKGLGSGGLGVPIVFGSFCLFFLRRSTTVTNGLQYSNGLVSISTVFRNFRTCMNKVMTEMTRRMVNTSST